jgi:hypothetical protein
MHAAYGFMKKLQLVRRNPTFRRNTRIMLHQANLCLHCLR